MSLKWLQAGPTAGARYVDAVYGADVTEGRVAEIGTAASGGFINVYSRADEDLNHPDPDAVWGKQDLVDIDPRGVTIADDYVYVSGFFRGNPDLNGDEVADLHGDSGGAYRGFVAKYSPAGNLVWAQQLDGTGESRLEDVAISSAGTVYASGHYRDSLNFGNALPDLTVHGGNPLTSDALVVALDSLSGSFVQAHGFGGSADEFVRAVHADSAGTIRAAGGFSSADAAFPNVSEAFATAGDVDGFVVAFTPPVNNAPPPITPIDIYVWDITFNSRSRGKQTYYQILVDVNQDANADGLSSATDASAAGAFVTIQLRRQDGSLVGNYSGTSDSEGIFRTDWLQGLASGSYTAEVVDLVHATFEWNHAFEPTLNDSDSDADGLADDTLIVP